MAASVPSSIGLQRLVFDMKPRNGDVDGNFQSIDVSCRMQLNVNGRPQHMFGSMTFERPCEAEIPPLKREPVEDSIGDRVHRRRASLSLLPPSLSPSVVSDDMPRVAAPVVPSGALSLRRSSCTCFPPSILDLPSTRQRCFEYFCVQTRYVFL